MVLNNEVRLNKESWFLLGFYGQNVVIVCSVCIMPEPQQQGRNCLKGRNNRVFFSWKDFQYVSMF